MKMLFNIILALSIFTGYQMFGHNIKEPSKAVLLVNKILSDTAKIIENKYKIQLSGTGAAMPGSIINELVLAFDINGPISKNELRKIIIESAQELLKQVNTNQDIQQFLIKTPFTEKNVEIILYNHDKNRREVYDPDIGVADISKGILGYFTVDPDDTFKYKNKYSETYEEALKALQNQ